MDIRFLRKTARRTRAVLKDSSGIFQAMQKADDDMGLLICFCWHCNALSHYITLCAQYEYLYRSNKTYESMLSIDQAMTLITHQDNIRDTIEFIRTLSLKTDVDCIIRDTKRENGSVKDNDLQETIPALLRVRNAVKMSECHFHRYEVPEILCSCVTVDGEPARSLIAYGTDYPAAVGSNLMLSYRDLLKKMTPLVMTEKYQATFNINCGLVAQAICANKERKAV